MSTLWWVYDSYVYTVVSLWLKCLLNTVVSLWLICLHSGESMTHMSIQCWDYDSYVYTVVNLQCFLHCGDSLTHMSTQWWAFNACYIVVTHCWVFDSYFYTVVSLHNAFYTVVSLWLICLISCEFSMLFILWWVFVSNVYLLRVSLSLSFVYTLLNSYAICLLSGDFVFWSNVCTTFLYLCRMKIPSFSAPILKYSIYKKCFTCLSLLQDRAILWGMDPESASFLLSVIGKRPCWQRPRGFGAKFKSKKLLSSLPSRAATAWLFSRDCQHSRPAHPRMGQRQGLGQQVSRFF